MTGIDGQGNLAVMKRVMRLAWSLSGDLKRLAARFVSDILPQHLFKVVVLCTIYNKKKAAHTERPYNRWLICYGTM